MKRSQYFSAVSSTCVDIKIAAPDSFFALKTFNNVRIPNGSNPKNGSSTTYNGTSNINAQTISTFCFIPFEK